MKKRAFERALVAVAACAVCVGVTSCGNDVADQEASASQTTTPEPAPQVQVQDRSATPPPAQVAEPAVVAPAVPAGTDVADDIDKLMLVARQQGADFLTPARAWAGASLQGKLRVCAIAQRAGRVADLVALAREARAACSGAEATYEHFYSIAQYFEAGAAFDEAREALDKAIPLADTPNRKADVAAFWRRLPRAK